MLAAFAAAALITAPARAEPKKQPKPLDPSLYVDPSYDPEAHGGLPYATYLRVTRGKFRRSTGMMVTGIVLVSAGSTAMAVATGAYVGAGNCREDIPTDFGGFARSSCSSRTGQITGMAVLIAGTIATGLGIPLWIVGASDVPWAEAASNDRSPTTALPAAARLVPVITPTVTGRGVALTWQF